MRRVLVGFALAALSSWLTGVRADTAADVRKAIGIRASDVLSSSVLTGKIVPGAEKQVVAITTYFTGRKDEANALNVRLDCFRKDGGALQTIFSRDFGRENGGFVGRGEVQLVDLDLDGVNEVIVSYDDARNPLIRRRVAEIVVHDASGFRAAWSGELEYDATRAARDVPAERRDRFARKVDIPATLRTRGITLFMIKNVLAVAGETLTEPKVVVETFPLRAPPPE
jgi:hypothetical protein